MKKLNNKGFTLIEMVIVIVIIAILAAMLVPSLLAYVDNANQKSFMNACDSIKTSTLTVITNAYASNVVIDDEEDLSSGGYLQSVVDLVNASILTTSIPDKGYQLEFETSGNAIATMYIQNSKYSGSWNGTSWDITAK